MIPKHIMESKLITDEQWEEYLELKENNTWWSNRLNAVERDKRELKDNWNELKEWLKDFKRLYEGNEFQNNAKFCITVDQALDKMEELEKGDSNE